MPRAQQVPFLIIGGGIGGMATALAVSAAGFPVHLVEQASEFGEIGAGIQLAPNATRILGRLGLLQAAEDVSAHLRRIVLLEATTGAPLSALDLGAGFRARYGAPYLVLHRGDLLDILLDACRASDLVTLETGRAVVHIEDRGDSALVSCAEGASYRCDALVGADGLWSTTRALVSADQPLCARYVAYRGTLPVGQLSDVELDDELIWIGPGMHFVQYPIRRAELYNRVAVFHSERYREGSSDWGTPDELDEHFASACPQVRAGVARINRDRWWPMHDRDPIDNWTTGRITLLGDAAHPMLQYLAQGACQAIEDADCMGRSMRACGGDIAAAFAAYQAERIPRTAVVQRAARIWGDLWHRDDDLLIALRNRVLRQRAADNYSDLDWLYLPVPRHS